MNEPRFKVLQEPLPGLKLFERDVRRDDRGALTRLFCADELSAAGFSPSVAQVNWTRTCSAGAVRGLHFQDPPHTEDKLITCLCGSVIDVLVDIRRRSPTFLQAHCEILRSDEPRSILAPKGFAHGFQTLCDGVEMLYVHSAPYVPAAEGGLRIDDPRLGIALPLTITDWSQRDRSFPLIGDTFRGLQW